MLFLITCLAAFRITRFITDDSIIEDLREAFFRRFPPDEEHALLQRFEITTAAGETFKGWREHPEGHQRKISKLGQLFACPWCIGAHISAATVAVVAQFSSVPLPVLWWLAVSAVVGLIARNLDGA